MLHILIAAGLVLGLAVGLLAAATGSEALMSVALASAPIGTVFMNAIRMVVIPLVMAVIFTGVARLGDLRKLGRLGGTTLGFYWITTPPAIVLGMATMGFFLRFAPEVAMPAAGEQAAPEIPGVVDFLVTLVPPNPFAAASAGSLLPLIVFTALFGAAAAALGGKHKEQLMTFADAVSATLVKLVWWVLWCAPVGVFGLAAPVTAQLGWDLVQSLAVFVAAVLAGLLLFTGGVFLVLLRWVGGIGPGRYVKGVFGATSIAFASTSTVAALPASLQEASGKLGVSENVADLVLPLGASLYRPGSALFQGAAVVFLAHLFEVPFPLAAAGGRGARRLPGRAHHRAGAVGEHLHHGARPGRGGGAARRAGHPARHRPHPGHVPHGDQPVGADHHVGFGRPLGGGRGRAGGRLPASYVSRTG